MKVYDTDNEGIKITVWLDDRLLKAMPEQQQTILKAVVGAKCQNIMIELINDLHQCLGISYGKFLRAQIKADPMGENEKEGEER